MTDSFDRTYSGVEKWPEVWEPFATEDEGRGFVDELAVEVGSDHPLFGVPMVCIGRALNCDDFLFKSEQQLANGDVVHAEVHLTWKGSAEMTGYPTTRLFDSFEDWVASQSVISAEEEAAWIRFSEKRWRNAERRRVFGLWGFWLVMMLGALALSLLIASAIAPAWFGL